MSVTFQPDTEITGEFYWSLIQPATPTNGDVELVLGEVFHDWSAEELQPVVHSIAKKLQYVASTLLSKPLAEEPA